MIRTAIALSITLAATTAHAEIFKCIDPDGKVEYRNSACPSGTQAALLETQVAANNTIEIRRSSEDRELRREKETREILNRPPAAQQPPKPVNALPPLPPEKAK